MNRQYIDRFHANAAIVWQQARQAARRVPMKARVVLGLFLVAAVFLAAYTGLTAKDSSLHLKVQHSFHNAQVSVWVDGDLAYSGIIAGSPKKRFGLLPTDSVRGTLSQIIAVRSGQRTVRVRIASDDAASQDDTISGDFASNCERDLVVSARRSGLSLSWQDSGSAGAEKFSSFLWLSRYAGSLLLTIAGSIISALTGFAIKELPGRLRSTGDSTSKTELGPQ
jgi:uncharacterized membrane protein